MKKIIALILALTLCLGLFAGCDNKEPAGKSDLEAATNYLKLLYRDSAEKTPSNYTVVNHVRVGETIFDVEWAVEVKSGDKEAVSVGDSNEIECTIVIKEDTREDTSYTLTGTIKGADGKTATVSFDHLIPKVPTVEEVINAAYALEPGAAMDSTSKLTGTVIKIDTPYDDGYKNVTVTIVCEGFEDKPIMCYRLKGEGADKIAVGDLITVNGTIKNYNGTIEFDAGCALVKLEAGAGKLPEGGNEGDKVDYSKMSPAEIVDAAYALEGGKSFDSEVSLTGVVSAVDTPFDPNYNNVTVTIIVEGKTDKPMKCFRMKGEGADQVAVGDTITVTGIIKNYVHSSGDSEIEFDAGCALTARTPGEGGNTGNEGGNTGNEGGNTGNEGGNTGNEGGDKVDYSKMTPAEIVDAAYALEGGKAFDSEVSLTGVVSAVDTPFDPNYNNVTVTIIVEGKTDKPMKCFRMKGEGADQVAVGDTITVTGIIKNYVHSSGDSEIEFDAGCALTARTPGEGGNTGNEGGNTGNEGGNTGTTVTGEYASTVTAGQAYKLALVQGNLENKTLYFAGTARDNQPWYMNTTENAAEAVDVYVEEVDGGLRLYFNVDGAKNYLDMHKNDTHYNLRITTEPTAVYTWNADHQTVVASVDGTDCYIGTYNTYNTMSCSKLEKIDGSFPAHFYPVG